MSRKIGKISYLPDRPYGVTDPVSTLTENAKIGRFAYILAHADDGIIWGVVTNGQVALSSASDAFPEISPQLRIETLWEVRLFGKDGELFIWRDGAAWKSREIRDGDGKPGAYYDEGVILWGTNAGRQEHKSEFWLAEEADTGIRHAPPLALKGRHSLQLIVRHYLADDKEGAVFVKFSRLVDLRNGGAN